MKKFSFILVFVAIALTSLSQVNYTIVGNIKGKSSGTIYLFVFSANGGMDSAVITKGKFHFKGSLAEPSPVILSTERRYVNKPMFMLFLDKGRHTVTLKKDDLPNSTVKGSKAAADFVQLQKAEKPLSDEFGKAYSILGKDTSKTAREELESVRKSVMQRRNDAQLAFIKAHTSSPVAAWSLHRNFSFDTDKAAEFEELYKTLSPSLHYTSYMMAIKETIEKRKIIAIGKIAPNFTQNDTSGNPVSLTDFRGKYVLVDFWASWCKPCRADNPNIVKAFNQFKDKGFTVLGVSLDQPGKKDAWLAAIYKDGLTWSHVSNLKFWDNVVAKQYGVQAVPFNLLLDKEGKIIAQNLHGGDLEKTLTGILGN